MIPNFFSYVGMNEEYYSTNSFALSKIENSTEMSESGLYHRISSKWCARHLVFLKYLYILR